MCACARQWDEQNNNENKGKSRTQTENKTRSIPTSGGSLNLVRGILLSCGLEEQQTSQFPNHGMILIF